MLSWSSAKTGETADLTAVAAGDGETRLEHGDALLQFATACAERDDDALAAARTALVGETDEAFMVDAAAVAGNFEMMTRLADSTGARMPASVLEDRAQAIGVMGVSTLTSKR
ncbi:MAG: hypothetical protein AAF567_18950 [Actinomycetota bacterium]